MTQLLLDIKAAVDAVSPTQTSLATYLLPTSPQRERDEVNYTSAAILNMGE
jgi:hypothetical protein